MALAYKLVRRKNSRGVMCIAPFFRATQYVNNGEAAAWINIWDIPEKEYTPAVHAAIISAFNRGYDERRAQYRAVCCEQLLPSYAQEYYAAMHAVETEKP